MQMSTQQSTDNNILLEVKGLKKHFPIHGGLLKRVVGQVKAVDGVNFYIKRGETRWWVGRRGGWGRSKQSTASIFISNVAKRWDWWARAAAARVPPAVQSSDYSTRLRVR